MFKHIAVHGASGAIGTAVVNHLLSEFPSAQIHACARRAIQFHDDRVSSHIIDYTHESSIADAAKRMTDHQPLDCVIVTTGMLHSDTIRPEKSLRDLNHEQLLELYRVNTVIPTLIAKYFIPCLSKQSRSIFAALSARVGSISDNRLGGWYSYRASKAALNMIIKTLAIETSRKNKQAIVVGLHPGTVDSDLSKPFQANVADDALFTPEHSAEHLVSVISKLESSDTGKCFAWDHTEIPA